MELLGSSSSFFKLQEFKLQDITEEEHDMGEVLQFKRRSIAFFGELLGEDGAILHTPYLHKICDPDTGEEVCPRLFTIDCFDDFPADDAKVNIAMGLMYLEFWTYFATLQDENSESFKAYAVSVDDGRILYSLVMTDEMWLGGEKYGSNAAMAVRLGKEKGIPMEEPSHKGNSIYVAGSVRTPEGECYQTPVVRRINNVENNKVLFPGMFTLRTIESFFGYGDCDGIISCLAQCLLAEAEEMGADTWLEGDTGPFQAVELSFVDRESGRVLYAMDAINSVNDGNVLIPERWEPGKTYPKYFDLENATFIDLNVGLEYDE